MVLGVMDMKRVCRVGIIAASSPVPMVELEQGLDRLREAGLDVRIHRFCGNRHFLFAGTDQQRAEALFEYASSPELDVLWCARGGYGATRILPLLDELTVRHGPPPRKLLVGYSDVTALHEYVRARWAWPTLHATMPGAFNFNEISEEHWTATLDLARGRPVAIRHDLRWLTPAPARAIEASLAGGNLTLWAVLAGTPYAPGAEGRIVFFEDVDEPWYRIDRMLTQIHQAGLLDRARAIVLGDFKACRDETHMMLKEPGGTEKVPLRAQFDQDTAFAHLFAELGRRLGIPVAAGLPAGHGPNFAPLPLGADYVLDPGGCLKMVGWNWTGEPLVHERSKP